MKVRTSHIQTKVSIAIIAATIVIGSCAKIGSPSGGPKDEDPPIAVNISPKNGATNFPGKKFTLEFNEYLNIDGLNDKLIVSPPLGKKPTVTMRGKSLIVEFQDELKENTTYSFFFQDGIRDLNENNPIENFQYVFSTGNVLDSLSVEGEVFALPTLIPSEEVYACLYRNLNYTAFKKTLPDYITKVKKDGSFRIDNISPGEYNLFALIDLDNNKMYNNAEETIAFLDSPIYISPETNYFPLVTSVRQQTDSLQMADSLNMTDSNNNKYIMYLSTAEKNRYYLTSSSRKSAKQMVFTTSLPPKDKDFVFSLPGFDENGFMVLYNAAKDTMNVWILDTAISNQQILRPVINYPFTDDSLGRVVQKRDTINMRFVEQRRTARSSSATVSPLSVDGNFFKRNLNPLLKFKLQTTSPISSFNESMIHFYERKDSLKKDIPFVMSKDEFDPTTINVSTTLNKGIEYLFVADSSAIKDIYGLVSDSIGKVFSIATDDNFGQLTFRISGYDGPRIIQFLSGDDSLLKEYYMEEDGDLMMPYIDKGKYKARVIYDLNGDKKWTPGDYDSKRQPEPVSYFLSDIEVKSNWEQIFDWDISEKNIKTKSSLQSSSSKAIDNSREMPSRTNTR
ncbi:MAG: Ig-like domain-containing protein [Bacteroidales bacterium]|nr:Ig-like domain-containing protein [Bacteroidales bacterium]